MSALDGALELLDRSTAYLSVALSHVAEEPGDSATDRDERMRDLLVHLTDSVETYTEAATGRVDPTTEAQGTPSEDPVTAARASTRELREAWIDHAAPPPSVDMGGIGLPGPLLLAAAALEITVHAWDVGRLLGHPAPIPDDLADVLLDLAPLLLAVDGPVCLTPPRPAPLGAPPGVRLAAFLGRPGPPPVGVQSAPDDHQGPWCQDALDRVDLARRTGDASDGRIG